MLFPVSLDSPLRMCAEFEVEEVEGRGIGDGEGCRGDGSSRGSLRGAGSQLLVPGIVPRVLPALVSHEVIQEIMPTSRHDLSKEY